MSEIDWSKAPEGATHCDPGSSKARWYRRNEGRWEYRSPCSGTWMRSNNSAPFFDRLKVRPTQWCGPEDGLPPVGTVCEYTASAKVPGDPSEWRSGDQIEILAHRQALMATVAVGWNLRTGTARGSVAAILSPLKSDKERAVEAALAQDCDPRNGMLSRHDFCARLYDAGLLRLPEEQS